ncbi:hypothetical protein GH714_018253 [Hevea brasiliensis]|uniref:Apple domain-containing protein n=1 Tax=Hevea brasiliensis TaxID=3981 RepID=A0A6A6KR63_HEVBR|nr:hypothetical protein GH714_018253 [Hevea brasiliensis]
MIQTQGLYGRLFVPQQTPFYQDKAFGREELVSSISNTNHTTGRFRLKMQRDGELAMYPTQYAAGDDSLYWNTATYTAGDNVSLNLDTDGKLYLLNATGFNIRTLNDGQTVFGNPIYRLTIDADGLFRLYSYNLDQNGTWLVAYQDSENKCLPKGLCGLNSYCIPLDQDTKCTCPLGFDFINPGQENLGCKRKSSVDDCVSTNYTILELESITWESDSDSVVRSSNKTECRDECLRDCNCEAALFDNQECKKQKLPLRFGRTNNDGETMVTLIKISNGEMGGKERPREMPTRNDSSIMIPKNNKSGLQIGILVAGATSSTFGLIILAISVALIFKHRVSIFKTFDAPTDTILLGQSLVAREQLVCSISNTSHMSGRFAVKMPRNGNLEMFALEYPVRRDYFYWRSCTRNARGNVLLNLDTNDLLYLLDTNGNNIRNLSDSRTIFGQALYRATIDADGIFRLYSHNLDRCSHWSLHVLVLLVLILLMKARRIWGANRIPMQMIACILKKVVTLLMNWKAYHGKLNHILLFRLVQKKLAERSA